MRSPRIPGLGLGLILVAACGPSGQDSGSTPAPAPSAVEAPVGPVWKWTGVRGGDPAVVPHPARYTVEFFADGRYSVRADCNSGAGSWSRDSDGFRMTGGPMTLAACGPETLDHRFLQLLETVHAFERPETGKLALLVGAGRTRLEFEAMREISLAGSSWKVRAYNNGREAVVSVESGSELHVEFNEDGTVTGSAGCNRFNASYTLDAQSLHFGPVAATRRRCPPESLMEQEAAFLAALGSVAAWQVRGGRAQLRSADGALAVDLVAAVTGTVVRAEGPPVPRGAILRIQLEDVSRADAPAPVVAEQSVALQGQGFPQTFELEFDPSEIVPSHTYSLRATISDASGLLYVSTTTHPVLTRDHARYGIEVALDPVDR